MKIIVYILSFAAALVLTLLKIVYLKRTGYFSFQKTEVKPLLESGIALPTAEEDGADASEVCDAEDLQSEAGTYAKNEENAFYGRTASIALTSLSLVMTFAVSVLLYKYSSNVLYYAKLIILYGIVSAAAITDFKRHKIPNALILTGLAARVVIYILEFIFLRDSFVSILKNDAVGFCIGFVVLFLVALIAANSLGFGDVKLCGILGILGGGVCTYAAVLLGFFVCAVTSVILLIAKKKDRRSQICLAPFIYLGFTVCAVLGIF